MINLSDPLDLSERAASDSVNRNNALSDDEPGDEAAALESQNLTPTFHSQDL